MLTLRIENFDRLPDGGPIVYRADRRGFDFGRAQYLDWTLPDPSLFISSKHCEIRFHNGGYWLHDVSSNGTVVNKSDRRVQSPYLLANGDELQVGDYIISVSISGLESQEPRQAAQSRGSAIPGGEVWAATSEPLPPISRKDLMPPVQKPSRAADFLNSVADVPPPSRSPDWADPAPARAPPDPWASTGFSHNPPPPDPPRQAAPLPDWSTPSQIQRNGQSMAALAREMSFAPAAPVKRPDEAVVTPPTPAPPPDAGPAPDAVRARIEREFIQRFAAGAGISETVLAGRSSAELAHELGQIMRIVCANLMQLLSARAAAKTLARTGDRTLIQSRDNNPLKFMPTPDEALRVILGPHSGSYLDGRQTFEHSFADLQAHELATFAAMQQALIQLLEDVTPESIEKAGGGAKKSLLGTNKGKLWDLFVERWKAKAARQENGMLDAFLDIFAAFYQRETQRRR